MRRLWLAVIGVAALLVAAIAHAEGGTSIANAPELPNGRQVSGAIARIDYWRVTIVPGDTLRIDYEPIGMSGQSNRHLGVCLMAPSVTDFTVSDSECFDWKTTDYSDRKRQTVHEFALPGRYTLLVANYPCLGSGTPDTKCKLAAAYELTGYIVHRTAIRLSSPPRLAKRGSLITIRGVVSGVTTGSVLVQQKIGGRWANKRVVKLSAGRFVTKVRATPAGNARFRVVYPGDATHKPSRASFSVTVA